MSVVTVYSTTWCGPCIRLKAQLDDAGIAYRVVDVDRHPEAGAKIEEVTGGLRIVPSVDVDGLLLVNPTLRDVTEAVRDSA